MNQDFGGKFAAPSPRNRGGNGAGFLNMSQMSATGCRQDRSQMTEMNHGYFDTQNPFKLHCPDNNLEGDPIPYGNTWVSVHSVCVKIPSLPAGVGIDDVQLAVVCSAIVGIFQIDGEPTHDLIYITGKTDSRGYVVFEYHEQSEDPFTYKLTEQDSEFGIVLMTKDKIRHVIEPSVPWSLVLKHYVP